MSTAQVSPSLPLGKQYDQVATIKGLWIQRDIRMTIIVFNTYPVACCSNRLATLEDVKTRGYISIEDENCIDVGTGQCHPMIQNNVDTTTERYAIQMFDILL